MMQSVVSGAKGRFAVTALAIAVVLWSNPPQGARADDGKRLFEAQCAQCHGPRDVAHWGRSRPDADDRAEWLDRFLKRHYPPADDERPVIIRHIQELIAAGDKK